MGELVSIDTSQLDILQKTMSEISAELDAKYMKQYADDIAKLITSKVEGRYKSSGLNQKGETWWGIKLSSYLRRGHTKTKSGRLSEHGKRVQGYKQMLNLDERIPTSQVRPLLTTSAAQTTWKIVKPGNGFVVTVSPRIKKQTGKNAGTYIAEFHKGGGKGIMPDRSAHFLDEKDAAEIIAIGERTLTRMMKEKMK